MFVFTLGDIFTVISVGLVLVIWAIIWIPIFIKRALCKHDGVVCETSACEAICGKCGKNLGFIGAWREIQDKRIDEK